MLAIQFAGWYQCRLATDPDSYDDKRGSSGWTFAMPGEPDLDRIIRFRDPVAARSHGPDVDVRVRSVVVNGSAVSGHPLEGAAVDLLDGAVYEGRNGEIATSAQEPIVPFHIRVQRDGIELIGRDPIDLTDFEDIARRQPVSFEGNSADVRQATGITDPAGHRSRRGDLLQADLVGETDPIKRQALQRRIGDLAQGSIRLTSLGFKLTYGFDLHGPNTWTDPQSALGPPPEAGTPWRTDFWMGGWDADALCGYVSGTLTIA